MISQQARAVTHVTAVSGTAANTGTIAVTVNWDYGTAIGDETSASSGVVIGCKVNTSGTWVMTMGSKSTAEWTSIAIGN